MREAVEVGIIDLMVGTKFSMSAPLFLVSTVIGAVVSVGFIWCVTYFCAHYEIIIRYKR